MATMHVIKCPNCNANISADDSIGEFECPYCNTVLIVEFENDAHYEARVKQEKIRSEERVRTKKIDSKVKIKEMEHDERTNELKLAFVLIIIGVAIPLSMMFFNWVDKASKGIPGWASGGALLIVVAAVAYIVAKKVGGNKS